MITETLTLQLMQDGVHYSIGGISRQTAERMEQIKKAEPGKWEDKEMDLLRLAKKQAQDTQ